MEQRRIFRHTENAWLKDRAQSRSECDILNPGHLLVRSRMGTQTPWEHRKRVPQTQLTSVFLGHQSVMSWLTVLNCLFLNQLFFLKKKKKIAILRIYVKPVDVTLITLLCLRKKEGLHSQSYSALGSAWAWSSSMCWPCSLPWNLCLRPSLLSGTRPMTDLCP